MTIAGLLQQLFNLGQQTDFLNSARAARDFWVLVALAVCVLVVGSVALHAAHRRSTRLPH
jgi:hypothetical protein